MRNSQPQFRLALAGGRRKGYIQLPESALFESRPGVPVMYAYGEVFKVDEDGKETVAYPNIVRIETTGGLAVPFAINKDGKVEIGLRPTQRLYAPRDQALYDAAMDAFKTALLLTFAHKVDPVIPESVKADQVGKWLQAQSDADDHTTDENRAAYLDIANHLIDRLNTVGFGRMSYEVPGGYGTFGETGDKAAKRQFFARTDPHTVIDGWVSLGGIVTNRGHELHTVALSAAKVDRSRFSQTVPGVKPDPYIGFATLEWYDAASIQKLRDDGLLWCGMTEAAIGRYAALAAARPDLLPPLY